MTTYTNPTNIFNFVPHDVTQWKINSYLTATDRCNLNAVLEPTERIYTKFPTDFAIKHSLKTFLMAQRRQAARLSDAMAACNRLIEKDELKADVKILRVLTQYVSFCSSLQAMLIFQYCGATKKGALHDLGLLVDIEGPTERFISPKLRDDILDTIDLVEDTAFLREVVLK